MDPVTKEKQRVQSAIRRELVTRRELARIAKVRDTVLIKVLYKTWNPNSVTLSKLSRALDSLGIDETGVKKKALQAA